ncbi:DUF3016 domain-containing protein [Glaciecola sp. 1036]|uniref:DUF3016 domain-containing protein n=1 Tax=Alteromonadaceae TaxID=72275 RepID=UPI003D015C93
MKPIILSLALLLSSSHVLAAEEESSTVVTESEENSVRIEWIEPKSFTDVRDRISSTEKYRRYVFNTIQKHFEKLTAELPAGYQLKMQVTDLDLAGDTRAGMSLFNDPNMYDVRVIRRIDIPRMQFSYELIDQAGEVLMSENVKLKDMGFLEGPRSIRNDRPLYYEKKMLTDWFNSTFKDVKAA